MQHDINALRKDVDATQNNVISLTQDKLNISDYTALDILSKLSTVDGANSGLDADKLDGVELQDIYAKYDVHNLDISNLNDINTPGLYGQTQNTYATGARNYPNTSVGAGVLEVLRVGGSFIMQRYNTYQGHIYTRFYQSWEPVGWSAWNKSDINPLSISASSGAGWIYLGNDLKMCWGSVLITPSAANTPTLATVTLPLTYTYGPQVLVTPETSVTGTQVTGVACANRNTTNIGVYVTRTNTTATYVRWFTIGK